MKKKLFAMTSALMVLLCCFAGCSNSIYIIICQCTAI